MAEIEPFEVNEAPPPLEFPAGDAKRAKSALLQKKEINTLSKQLDSTSLTVDSKSKSTKDHIIHTGPGGKNDSFPEFHCSLCGSIYLRGTF